MTSITIDVPDDQLRKLQSLTKAHGVFQEELLRSSVEDWLRSPKPEFSDAASYVLRQIEKY
jgi:antitoxin FitA